MKSDERATIFIRLGIIRFMGFIHRNRTPDISFILNFYFTTVFQHHRYKISLRLPRDVISQDIFNSKNYILNIHIKPLALKSIYENLKTDRSSRNFQRIK